MQASQHPVDFGSITLLLERNQILLHPQIKITLLLHKLLYHFYGAIEEDESLGETGTQGSLGSPGWRGSV